MAHTVTWAAPLDLSFPPLDADHQQVLSCLNRLIRAFASRNKTSAFLAYQALKAETQRHFASENALMQQSGYPDFVAHRKAHEELLERMTNFQSRLHEATVGDPNNPASQVFLTRWFTQHIMVDDRALADFLRQSEHVSLLPAI